MAYCAFPVAKGRKRKRDVEKPWLDDVDFKELVREKGELYSRKIRRKLREGRLAEVTKEVRGREVRGSYWGLESYLGHAGGGLWGEKRVGLGLPVAILAIGVEENCVRFGNEFWDMYNCAFPVAKRRKRKRDVEKRWLNDVDLVHGACWGRFLGEKKRWDWVYLWLFC